MNSISLSILTQESSWGSKDGGSMEGVKVFNCLISCNGGSRIGIAGSGEFSLKVTFRMKSARTARATIILK